MIKKSTLAVIKEYLSLKSLLSIQQGQLEQLNEKIRHCDPQSKSSVNKEISDIKKNISNNQKNIEEIERVLKRLRDKTEENHFEVFYLHYVKGVSLSRTAKRLHYSKSGVCKILKKITSK